MNDFAAILERMRSQPSTPRPVARPSVQPMAVMANGRIGIVADGTLSAFVMPCRRPDCDGGWVISGGSQRQCVCTTVEAATARRITAIGVPARLWMAATDSPIDDSPALRACTTIASGMGARSLSMHGSLGCGKSHLAAWAALRAAIMGATVRWTMPIRLTMEVKDGYDKRRSQADSLAPYIAADVLVIDDLQDPHDRKHMRELIQAVLWERHDGSTSAAQRPTIVTTNAEAPGGSKPCELQPLVGDRIWSRMREDFEFVKVFGGGWRR